MNELLRRGLTAALSVGPVRDRIVLESNPDLACNTWPVFEELLARGVDEKYELCWLVRDPARWAGRFPGRRVRFAAYAPESKASRLAAARLQLHARCVIFANKTVWQPRPGQLSLFLGHGSPIKACKGFYTPGPFCNRWLSPSAPLEPVMEEQLGLPPGGALRLGYPRNDALLRPTGALDRLVDRRGRKIVFWLPTFRQHSRKADDSNYALPGCGLPLLERPGALERVNEALCRAGVLLVLKPHPMQDLAAIRAGELPAFRLLSDADLAAADCRLYEALADADALMTDYSSVYCDFLLTGKPIALTLDDLAQYQSARGLVTDDPLSLLKGRYLYTEEDLTAFAGELSRGEDPCAGEREAACVYYNQYRDDGAARRVADYVTAWLNDRAEGRA